MPELDVTVEDNQDAVAQPIEVRTQWTNIAAIANDNGTKSLS